MHAAGRAFAIVLGAIVVGTAGCGQHGREQSAPVTTSATRTTATGPGPTITPKTAGRAAWVRAANRFCVALFEEARAYATANPGLGPSRGNIVDPAYEHSEALRSERASLALAAIPAPAQDKPSISRAVAALHKSSIKHDAAASIDSDTGADHPEAVLEYDAALDSEGQAFSILVRLGAESCRT